MALRLVMRSPFVVIGAMVMAFTVDVKCALIFAAVIPLLTIVVFAIMFGSIPLYQNVQKKLDGILGRTRENLLGVRVLRAFRKE
ncbi:MAG TPA: ATP-binding protein, partial [Ruminococcus sp.]|nr:ATP-binding protein [Ruminococcus sp.]